MLSPEQPRLVSVLTLGVSLGLMTIGCSPENQTGVADPQPPTESSASTASTADDETTPSTQDVASSFADAFFVKHDVNAALQFVDENAVRKTGEAGSLATFLKGRPAGELEQLTLRQLEFFEKSGASRLENQFPGNYWSRLSSWPDDAQLCLIVLEVAGTDEIVPVVVAIKDSDGDAKVVFWDDD